MSLSWVDEGLADTIDVALAAACFDVRNCTGDNRYEDRSRMRVPGRSGPRLPRDLRMDHIRWIRYVNNIGRLVQLDSESGDEVINESAPREDR
jgi:hypothetical protein